LLEDRRDRAAVLRQVHRRVERRAAGGEGDRVRRDRAGRQRAGELDRDRRAGPHLGGAGRRRPRRDRQPGPGVGPGQVVAAPGGGGGDEEDQTGSRAHDLLGGKGARAGLRGRGGRRRGGRRRRRGGRRGRLDDVELDAPVGGAAAARGVVRDRLLLA